MAAIVSGITFVTLEDETGFVDIVLRRTVFEELALRARTELFLGVPAGLKSNKASST